VRPLQAAYARLAAEDGEALRILRRGADKASVTAKATMTRVRDHLGLPAI
jgi:hypothetical protein